MPTLRHLALPLSEIAHKGTTFYPPDQNFYNLFFIGNAWINRVCRENIFMFSSDYTPYLADFTTFADITRSTASTTFSKYATKLTAYEIF